MKTWLFPCVVATAAFGLSLSAHAEPTTIPGIVVVPTEPVDLIPAGTGGDPACTGAGAQHSGLGCAGVAEPTTFEPYADAVNLTENLTAALAPFDVTVTNTRPPKYVPYMLILADDAVSKESQSFTCTGGGVDCSALSRHRVGTIIGGSMNCMDPDFLHAALYTFGRLSGLEGSDVAMDPMFYLPDFTMPATEFQDMCGALVPQEGFNDRGMQVTLPLECTSLDHTGCEEAMQQNSVADLTATYGVAPAEPDADPPVIAITSPRDGAVFMAGEDVIVDGTVEDNDAYVGAMWTVQGAGLADPNFLDGVEVYEYCTNTACIPTEGALAGAAPPLTGWEEVDQAKATDSSFAMPTFTGGLPAGEYTVTFEAADMHGNVAAPVSITFTVEEAPSGTGDETAGGGVDDTAGGADDVLDDGGVFTTGVDDDGDGDGTGSGSAGEDDDSGGCACNTAPGRSGLVALMFGLLGLGLSRRRK
jgi:MYXO-CTERM domain-containing protein